MDKIPDDKVIPMQVIEYDPNRPYIDADQYTQQQQIVADLALQADARLASFMSACKVLREQSDVIIAVDEFVNSFLTVYFDGRVDLPSTERHKNVIALVLKATLINMVEKFGSPAEVKE